ncbi:MAG: SRPBCC family protein [Arenicellales bacterium]
MLTYETSVSISAPQEMVWRVLSDVAAWPDWLPTVDKVEPLDGRVLQLGSRFLVQQPRLRPATWTVTELEQPRRFVWLARSPGLKMLADHTVDEESPGFSRVVLRFSFAGPLGGLLGRAFRSVTESYIMQEAASLKQKVEASR